MLGHPWFRDCQDVKIVLDIAIYRLVRSYICSSSLRKSALRSLAKTLTVDELVYLRQQFALLGPSKSGSISLQNFKNAFMKNTTKAMEDCKVIEFVDLVSTTQYLLILRNEDIWHDSWEQRSRCAYGFFNKGGNRPIMIHELASELGLSPSEPIHTVFQDWINYADGKLSFVGFIKLLRGVSSHSITKV
ncbi:uncharacterized protein A4U43_C02F19610 [Asparagus officinalis]|uniref:EF-hand domain-containing protein n=1 Tax=Asparagus officinalis TaxID=4686 RepID=A0A5P1FM88_ASPOF|nr:uncharacterized protein A4U43_C02F19610 [Asparagus officinalis]